MDTIFTAYIAQLFDAESEVARLRAELEKERSLHDTIVKSLKSVLDDAIGAVGKNLDEVERKEAVIKRLLRDKHDAVAAKDTEWERALSAETSLANLARYAKSLDPNDAKLPMSGHAITVRGILEKLSWQRTTLKFEDFATMYLVEFRNKGRIDGGNWTALIDPGDLLYTNKDAAIAAAKQRAFQHLHNEYRVVTAHAGACPASRGSNVVSEIISA